MSAWPEPASFHDPQPVTMKYCKICHGETPHQIRTGHGVNAIICVPCLRRAMSYELDRD